MLHICIVYSFTETKTHIYQHEVHRNFHKYRHFLPTTARNEEKDTVQANT